MQASLPSSIHVTGSPVIRSFGYSPSPQPAGAINGEQQLNNEQVRQLFSSELQRLDNSTRDVIGRLTQLAATHVTFATAIVKSIEDHIRVVSKLLDLTHH